MRRIIITAALGALALGLAAGCGGAGAVTSAAANACPSGQFAQASGGCYNPDSAPQPVQPAPSATDPNGVTCSALDSLGYCPGDDPATAAPTVTDPSGETCSALDSNGYCPGDDPAPAAPSVTDPSGDTCSALDSQGYCPGDDPAPAMTKQTDTIVFKVSGSGEPSIQYGSDSSTNNPSDGVGPLGDGNYLPWTASMPYNASALYYAVTAQLEGSGSIQDSVTEVVTTWCSGSNPKTESFPLASGQASGGYGIATAEYAEGDTGNATQAESDAGC